MSDDPVKIASALRDLSTGDDVALTLIGGNEVAGVVVHTDYQPAVHDAGDGLPASGRLTMGLELFAESIGWLDYDGVVADISATERRVDDWLPADVDMAEPTADGTAVEYVGLGEIASVRPLEGSETK